MTNEQLKALLSGMLLKDKIGQLVQWNLVDIKRTGAKISGPEVDGAEEGNNCYTSVLNFATPEECAELQKEHLEKDPCHIPILFMMDVIHGYKTIFPVPMALTGSFNPELVTECSRMAAEEAAAGGIHATFTPMVDHVRDARWGRVMESAGEDPWLGGIMGAAQIKGFHGEGLNTQTGLATCVKHFAGYGAAIAGRDYTDAEVSEHTMREWYLPAYKACVDAGVDMVMPSFNVMNGIPSAANPWLMKTILRDEWKFDGVTITDYNALGELLSHGVTGNKKDSARLGIENENDIDMVSGAYSLYLEELVNEGKVDEKAIDKAVWRVLKLKNKLGLFEDPYRDAGTEKLKKVSLTKEHRAIAKRAALECAVLLKNEGILPLSRKARKVALIGPFADNGSIIGAWQCNGDPRDTVTVLQGVKNILPDADVTAVKGCNEWMNDTDVSGIEEAVNAAKNAEAAVLCLGEPMDYSGEGRSRATLTLPGKQMELARAVLAVKPDTAVLLFGGRPLEVTELEKIAPAMLDMFMPGTEGGNAAAELLFGEANPCGKLVMSFPKAVGQEPLFYAHTRTGRPKSQPEGVYEPYYSNYIDCGNLPLYPFGYGKSYTEFVYEDMKLEKTEINAGEDLDVTVTVRNAGSRAGKEVVQLYLNDLVSSVATPVQKLCAFQKVELQSGESKKITLTVSHERMMLWNFEQKHVTEPGEFDIFAGWAENPIITKRFTVR